MELGETLNMTALKDDQSFCIGLKILNWTSGPEVMASRRRAWFWPSLDPNLGLKAWVKFYKILEVRKGSRGTSFEFRLSLGYALAQVRSSKSE